MLEAILDGFDVDSSSLPSKLRGKRSRKSLRQVWNQINKERAKKEFDPRDVSVKFVGGTITQATMQRLKMLQRYSENVAKNEDIDYLPNEDKLYAHEVAFCKLAGLEIE